MTWRRFLTLIKGFSPDSAAVTQMVSRATIGGKRRDEVIITDRAAAQAAFESIHSGAQRANP